MTNYVGWLLPEFERERLLKIIPPVYSKIVAHHITLQYDVPDNEPLPTTTSAEIIGLADDGKGVQAVVVRIGGTSKRPDGKTYHITWSLTGKRRPVESNYVIQKYGWKDLPDYIVIKIEPRLFGDG